MRFEGKTIVITGGTSGIGFATAKQIIAEGGKVALTGRNAEKLDRAVQELGSQAKGYVADSSNLRQLEELAAKIKADYQNVHGLFLNAGVPLIRSLAQTSEIDFDQLMSVNVKGVFFSLQKLAPVLANNSSVVITGSVLGHKAAPQMIAYAATKAAVRSLARSASVELLPRGIRVNVLSPGPIETPLWEVEGNSMPKENLEQFAQSHPMKRFGRPEEVSAVAAMLLSNDSTYIAGSEFAVDGGIGEF